MCKRDVANTWSLACRATVRENPGARPTSPRQGALPLTRARHGRPAKNFWGAAEVRDVELDEGPVGIIMSYLHKEDHEN